MMSPHLYDEELIAALTYMPPYNPNILNASKDKRLDEMTAIGKLFMPTETAIDIYHRMYGMVKVGMDAKNDSAALVRRQYQLRTNLAGGVNPTRIHGEALGGYNCASIKGEAGIGKSRAVEQAANLIAGDYLWETEHTHDPVIPFLYTNCMAGLSIKTWASQILEMVNTAIPMSTEEEIYRISGRTVEAVFNRMIAVCAHHVGCLIVDESENLLRLKENATLLSMLTHLINTAGVTVLFVGTPESSEYFSQTEFMARRAVGPTYLPLSNGPEYRRFVTTVMSYKYAEYTETLDAYVDLLHALSSGHLSHTVSILMAANRRAILADKPISRQLIREAALNDLDDIYRYKVHATTADTAVIPNAVVGRTRRTGRKNGIEQAEESVSTVIRSTDSIKDTVKQALSEGRDPVTALRAIVRVDIVSAK